MLINSAKYEGGKLILSALGRDAAQLAYNFKPGEYQISPVKKKRSLDANAYLWVLCEKIAKAVGITKEEVYRKNINDVGVCEPLPIKAIAVDEFCRKWSARGIGWFVEIIDDSKLEGYKLVHAYYGSSVYNTQEMARLLDSVIQDAKSVDVETLRPEELERMKAAWQ